MKAIKRKTTLRQKKGHRQKKSRRHTKSHRQKKSSRHTKSRRQKKSSRHTKSRKRNKKKKRGGAFNLTTDILFVKLESIQDEVSELFKNKKCTRLGCDGDILADFERSVCDKCGKSLLTEEQAKLLEMTKDDNMGEYDGNEYGTLYQMFLLINSNNKDLMKTTIMENVNKYLNGILDFVDLYQITFKNMRALEPPIPGNNNTMDEESDDESISSSIYNPGTDDGMDDGMDEN